MAETPMPINPALGFELPVRTVTRGEAHVWKLPLDLDKRMLAKVASLLSPDERKRADRFQFEVHRDRFIAGRGMLRLILGRYCDVQPAELRFDYAPNGKPILRWGEGICSSGDALHFNLAHSEGVGVLAVTRVGPVGVDVEQVREFPEVSELVRRFFSVGEAAEFSTLRREGQSTAFFTLWTRKEALLKAIGEGIGQSLDRVEVTFLPGVPARVLSLPTYLAASCEWSLVDLMISPSYVGALALPVRKAPVSQFQFNPGDSARPVSRDVWKSPVDGSDVATVYETVGIDIAAHAVDAAFACGSDVVVSSK
jgi:4'-phosphopantetheinyl transferase